MSGVILLGGIPFTGPEGNNLRFISSCSPIFTKVVLVNREINIILELRFGKCNCPLVVGNKYNCSPKASIALGQDPSCWAPVD
jgi:hypothetical protein